MPLVMLLMGCAGFLFAGFLFTASPIWYVGVWFWVASAMFGWLAARVIAEGFE